MVKGALLTNDLRFHRGMGHNPLCPRCYVHRESIEHVFRFCPFAKDVWNRVWDGTLATRFWESYWNSWIGMNQDGTQNNGQDNWALKFGVTLGFIWKARNDMVFNQSTTHPSGGEATIKKAMTEIIHSRCMHGRIHNTHMSRGADFSICWYPPSPGFVKVNSDGAVSHPSGNAACGGVLRGRDGNFITAFTNHLGVCSGVHAKLWAIFLGVQIAGDSGFDKICVESDSLLAINFLNIGCPESHACYLLVVIFSIFARTG